MKKVLLIGGGSALLLLCILFGAFFAGPLFASAQSGLTNTSSTPTATNPYCQQYLQDLANRLHVPVGTLQQAKLSAAEDVLAQLVKDGKLTQDQANRIRSRLESHKACTGNRQGFWGRGRGIVLQSLKQYLPNVTDQVAQNLHLTANQLKSQLQSGKSLSDIATAQGVSSSQLHTIVINAIQNALNKAVSDGNLTQQQATNFMQYVQNHPALLNRILNAHHGQHQ